MNRRAAGVRESVHPRDGSRTAPLRRLLTGAAAFALTAVVFAADDNKIIFPQGNPPTAAPASSGGTLNTMTLLLAILFAAVGGWLYWRNRRRPGAQRDAHLLAVDETRPLGNRQYLVVASYEDKKFLLGVCPGRIEMLAPLHDDAAKESKNS